MAGKGTVLLPKSDKDFSRGEFWEKFFKNRGSQSFEWYGEYSTLCAVLHKYIKARDKLLIVGCGNSSLGADLYDTGHCRRITSIDSSAVAIRQMAQKHKKRRSGMEFLKMDATDLQDFPDAAFTCALDKATLDAVFSNDEQRETAARLLKEVGRVLSVGGRYIIVSLAQEHILRLMCDVFTEQGRGGGWLIRVLVVPQAEESDLHLPVFAFVFTKCVGHPRLPLIVEVENPGAEKLTRLASVDQLVEWVSALQEAAMLSQSVTAEQEGRVTFENELGQTTYTCFLLQRRRPSKLPFAVFVVPFGKHASSSFCGAAARRDVVEAVATQRLLMVFLHPDVFYESHDAVKAALSRVVMRYAPHRVDSPLREAEVQFLSCGDIYPSAAVAERCVGAGDGAGEDGLRLLVEEVAGWGRRVLLPDCPGRLPVAGVASDRVASHVRAWLRGASGRILTAGATPVFPAALAPQAQLSCCLFVPADVRLPMGEALRDHVLHESLRSVRLLPDLDACGTFDVVVWRGGEPPESLPHLCPAGLMLVVGPLTDSLPTPALSYEVLEPGLDTRTRLHVWTDDPECLFSRVASQSADEEDEEMVVVLQEVRAQVEKK